MKRTRIPLLALSAALLTPCGTPVTAEEGSKTGDSPVARLLATMPAKSAAEQHEASARLVELGPAAVAEVCGRLVQPGTGDDRFFRRLSVDLRIDDTSRSYHVPLLLAPYSMTTYRGS